MNDNNINITSNEISLGAPCFREDSEIVVRKINYNYMQKYLLKSVTRRFQIFNNIYLYYMQKCNSSKLPKHRLDLTFLKQTPTYSLSISWKLLTIGLAFIGLSYLLETSFQLPLIPELPDTMPPLSVLTAIAGAMFLLLAYQRTHLSLVFKTYAGHAPVLFITPRPLQKDYRQFIKTLKLGISIAQNRDSLTIKDRLVGEMKDLGRLRESNIITKQVYRKAQARILANKSFSR